VKNEGMAEVLDDFAIIDTIISDKSVVVSGAAGCGKSMFMRYFWVSYFVDSKGRIPLFVELRNLNSLEQSDLLTFSYHNTVSHSSELGDRGRSIFNSTVEEGQFIFIFDGFDELNDAKREAVELQILYLSQARKNVIVVSGRPDRRFQAWQQFTVYNVEPLSKEKAVLLIERIDFDRAVKKKFVQELRKNLYENHRDFASRPLLLTMMLLTYNSFADIPEKIHVFYDQAFDTLFCRHDATKEAFKRQKYTNYSIDDFKRLLSYFSITTYIDQAFEFTDATLLEYIKLSADMYGFREVNCELFAKDLLESVSILQRDGLNIKFSHRSFQEYFSAYALVRLSRNVVQSLFVECSFRNRDSVMSMVFDMNKAFIEDNYIDVLGRNLRRLFCYLRRRRMTMWNI
jgi:predicted NACHT family NTPase